MLFVSKREEIAWIAYHTCQITWFNILHGICKAERCEVAMPQLRGRLSLITIKKWNYRSKLLEAVL
jgi:hypothetical protein